eukprot:CAMPEP_0184671186 /NCGR_PEP_ID=MMETSP0308-20130426/85287_1 /TAXON_ID=38269 /ORGANISM="Gloeochaete witrockiana, Strain SAG 46.84" /LENGTH=649 /DNA_ID=CAMNT_0027118269 /DNA_START=291 /DNA_END=2240 /DNA_ORIENTATION=+
MIISQVQPVLGALKIPTVNGLVLSTVSLGNIPPKVYDFRVFYTRRSEVLMEFTFDYVGKMKMVLDIKVGRSGATVTLPIEAALRRLQLRIKAKMWCGKAFPPKGPAWVSLARDPILDFSFKPLGPIDLMDLPGLSQAVNDGIISVVHSMLVWPKSICVFGSATEMKEDGEKEDIKGVLVVHVVECRGLENKEATGLSDPFCVVQLGRMKQQTRRVRQCLYPFFNTRFEFPFLLDEQHTHLRMEVFDQNTVKNESMGTAELDLSEQEPNTYKDYDLVLRGVACGRLIARVAILPYGTVDPDTNHVVAIESIKSSPTVVKELRGNLEVELIECRHLPALDGNTAMLPYVTLRVGDKRVKSSTGINTPGPEFGMTYYFPIESHGALKGKVRRKAASILSNEDVIVGEIEVLLGELEDRVPKDLWVNLTKAASGQVHLRLTMKYGEPGQLSFKKTGDPSSPQRVTSIAQRMFSTKTSMTNVPISIASGSITESVSIESKDTTLRSTASDGEGGSVLFEDIIRTRSQKTPTTGTARTIQVTVIEGKNLANVEKFGKSDPYCVVSIGESNAKTKTIKGDLNPTWNEQLQINFEEGADAVFRFSVFDFETLGADRLLGDATIPLADLVKGEPLDLWLLLLLKQKEQGSIHVVLLEA